MVGTEECLAERELFGLSLYPVPMTGTLFVIEEQVAYLYVASALVHTCW